MNKTTVVASLLAWLGMLNAMCMTPVAYAASADDEDREVEHIIVTATRMDRERSLVARSLDVVDRKTIESIQGQSVADVVTYLPNVTVAGGPRAGSQTVNIRGLGGNKLLQTIDGARMSFESGHRPSYYLDPELLQRVEALRGPASSLWGSGALGGVIAQRTLEPLDLTGPDSPGGFLRTGFNDNTEQFTTTLAVADEMDSVGWLVSGYRRDGDDIHLGNGERLVGSASTDQGGLLKLNWYPAENQKFYFSLRASENDGTVPSNGTAPINTTSNFLIERNTATSNAILGWDYDPANDWLDSQVLVYLNQVDIDEARVTDARADSTELKEYGVNLMNVSRISTFTFHYGADLYREAFSTRRGGFARPEPPRARSDVWSLYLQASVPVFERWRVDLGVRHDSFSTTADNLNEERSNSDTSKSAALVWQAVQWATLAVRYDEAFRAPTAEELYTGGTHFCLGPGFCNTFIPNPSLDPEQAANLEFLARFGFSNILGADQVTLQTSFFRNKVDDFIEQIVSGPSFFPFPDAGNTQWENVRRATITGMEVEAGYLRGPFKLLLAYGQTRGEAENTGQDLTNMPADTLMADFSYRFDDDSILAGMRLSHAAPQRRAGFSEDGANPGYEGYSTADLYFRWAPQRLPDIRFDVNVNNLTDRFYTRAWEQLPESGREIIVSARYSF
ncbi:MAG: TonB-dependent hemoglobin/transferrin/lactoferrin family receptor [bacterium]